MDRFHRTLIAVVVLALIVPLAGCDVSKKSKSKKDDPVAKNMAKNLDMSEKDAQAMLSSIDTKVKPTDPPKGWVPLRDGVWGRPPLHNFTTNTNVVSFENDPKDKISAEDVVLQSKPALQQQLQSPITWSHEEDVDFHGHTGRRLEYRTKYSTFTIHGIQFYVNVKGRMYVVTGTTLEQDLPKLRKELEKVMFSYDLEHRA
jgi:hypothetical protein